MKRLIVNADDFGFTRDVNAGIIEAHRNGILTATTLMATGCAFDDAVRLARETPTLDIGCHLMLVQSPGLPDTVPQLMRAVALGRIPILVELRRQVRKILDAGLKPTHLDTHKHTHLLPPVLDAMAQIADEFRIPWVRRPFDFPMNSAGVTLAKRVVAGGMQVVRIRMQLVLNQYGCKTTDHFAGFQITGKYDGWELKRLIDQLPDGLTEFMCHPGFCTAELRAATTRLKESRQQELEALKSPLVREALTRNEVVLVNYRSL